MRLDYHGLNAKQVLFVKAYRQHRNGRLALQEAGYASTSYTRVMGTPAIAKLIQIIDMSKDFQSAVTKDWIETKLVNIVLSSDVEEDLKFKDKTEIQMKALKQLTDLNGFDEPKRHVVDTNNVVINYIRPTTDTTVPTEITESEKNIIDKLIDNE